MRFVPSLTTLCPPSSSFDWKTIYKLKHNWRRGASQIYYLSIPCQSSTIKSRGLASALDRLPVNQKQAVDVLIAKIKNNKNMEDSVDKDKRVEMEDEEEQQNTTPRRSTKQLMTARNQFMASVDENCVLTVSNCEQTFFIQTNIKDHLVNRSADILGLPSTIVISYSGFLRISIGFTSGSFAIFSLEGLKDPNPMLVIKHLAVMDHFKYGAIRNIVHRQNIIAAYTDKANVLLFSIAEGDTRTISILKSYIDPTQAISFSIRSFNYQQPLFCISIAYCRPTTNGTWIPYIQEILCALDGSIVNTRMSTCSSNTDSHSAPRVHNTIPPTSISYNHPYLLAGYDDSTLSYYNVQSADCCLEIQPKKKLWGHTKGIKHVSVKQGGAAVTVSSGFPEVRWWDLEEKDDSTPIYVPYELPAAPKNKKARIEEHSLSRLTNTDDLRRISTRYTIDQQRTGNFLTFDDEMIIVEVLQRTKTPNEQGDNHHAYESSEDNDEEFMIEKRLMICDFR